jgi:hypothetical protein
MIPAPHATRAQGVPLRPRRTCAPSTRARVQRWQAPSAEGVRACQCQTRAQCPPPARRPKASQYMCRGKKRGRRRTDLDCKYCVGGSVADVARERYVNAKAVHKSMHSDDHRYSRAFGGRYGVLECEDVGVQLQRASRGVRCRRDEGGSGGIDWAKPSAHIKT